MDIATVFSGFAVGVLVGLTGVGGGSIMTPLLTAVFGVAPTAAVGTDLAFASITKAAGTVTHRSQGSVAWPIVRLLCFASLPAAAVALLVIRAIGTDAAGLVAFVRISIAVLVLITAMLVLFRRRVLAAVRRRCPAGPAPSSRRRLTIVAGLFIGAAVAISSIGAGAVGATLIALLYPELDPAEIAGTDIAYAVPLTGFAALGHAWLGTIDVTLLGALLVGSLPGIVLGSRASMRLPEQWTRTALAGVLAVSGLKLLSM